MSDPEKMTDPQAPSVPEVPAEETGESFGELFLQYEQTRPKKERDRSAGIEGTVISVSGDSVVLDIGFKTEGILPLA